MGHARGLVFQDLQATRTGNTESGISMKKRSSVFLLAAFLWLALSGACGAANLALQERDEWAGTYFKGRKLGFTHARVDLQGDEVVVHTRVFFRLKAGGAEQSTIITQETRLDRQLHLKEFSLLQEVMGNRQRVLGKLRDGRLEYEVTTTGYQKTKSMPYPADVMPASTVWLNMLDRGLAVGQKGTIRLFIEPFQMIVPMHYEILRRESILQEGRNVSAFVIEQEYAGMKSTLWVSPGGTVIKESTLQGFESRQETEAVAQDLGHETISVSNFITLSLVTPNRPIADPTEMEWMRFRIAPLSGPDSLPQDQRQKILSLEPEGSGGKFRATVEIRREAALESSAEVIPVSTVPDPALLEETAEIQARNGLIRGQARMIVGEEKDAWRAALKINRWVHRNIQKVLVDSFTALDALNSRRGECQSHTNLFTALARAEGIPTRVVNGLVYSRQYKGFLYHAWPEVFVGEWRALDPTFGQDAVDATHIKLSVGNYDGAIKLMEFLGQVQVELLNP